MKKSETDALKKAFNIPEPENKEIFISSYKEKLKKNKRTLTLPIIMRYASTAVAAALIVGLWGSLSRTSEYRERFEESSAVIDVQTETEAVTEDITVNDITSPTEGCTEPEETEPTTAVSTDVQGNISRPQTTTAVSGGSSQQSTEAVNTSAVTQTGTQSSVPATTAKAQSGGTRPSTTTKAQSGGIASSATTAREETRPVRTTAAEENLAPPVTGEIAQPTVTTSIVEDVPVEATTAPSYEPEPIETEEATAPSDDVTDDIGGKDYTVTPTVVYDKYGDIYYPDDSEDSMTPGGSAPEKSRWQIMADNSDFIVYGEIDEIIYTAVDGMPYTQLNVFLYEVYKTDGTIYCMDRISVYLPGGYMTASDYREYNYLPSYIPDDGIVFDSGGNVHEPQMGEKFIFFLNEGIEVFPDGAYTLTETTDISMFMYNDEMYCSAGDVTIKFEESELKEYLTA